MPLRSDFNLWIKKIAQLLRERRWHDIDLVLQENWSQRMLIKIAQCDRDIELCFPVMYELRSHLLQDEFISRIKCQQDKYGYRLAYLENTGNITTVAGFRISESLAWGKFLYIDDLVTAADARSQGYGDAMFSWLVEYAKSHDCEQLHLDSGVQRFAAHRFYLKQRMEISSHHFSIKL